MLEIVLLTVIFMAFWYVFLAVKAVLYWMWERVLAVRAFSLALSLECRRRRDRKREELRVNKDALDQYRLAQNAATLREQQQQDTAAKLRRAFENLSGLHGFMSLAADAAEAGEFAVKKKRELFNEYLPAVVKEAEACLRSGVEQTALRKFLAHLAIACGLPDAQADLVLSSASARVQPNRDKRFDFASQVEQELSLHRERLQAIEQLRDDPAFEEMLEGEHRRHSQVLVQLAAADRTPSPHVVTL